MRCFFAAVFVDQADGRLVLFGTLKVISRYVAAEDSPGQVVVLEQRRPSEADERCVRQCQSHVARKFFPLGTVSLVRNDDDVVPFAVWPRHILVELVNQAKDKPVVLSKLSL